MKLKFKRLSNNAGIRMSNEVVYLDELLGSLEIYGIDTSKLIIIESEESE